MGKKKEVEESIGVLPSYHKRLVKEREKELIAKKERNKKLADKVSYGLVSFIYLFMAMFNLALFGFFFVVLYKVGYDKTLVWVLTFIGANVFIFVLLYAQYINKMEGKK